MIRIINLKTNLYKDINLDNINLDNMTLKDFGKIIKFYANLENYNYKIYR